LTAQLALFSEETDRPEGLQYTAEFISPAEERVLIGHVSALPLQPFQFGAYEGKRRVASFGFRYDYTLRRLQPAEPIPGWLEPLSGESRPMVDDRPGLRRFSAPNTRSASGLAGIATSRNSAGYLVSRSAHRASSASGGRPTRSGSATRSQPRRARSTCCRARPG
jgi:hypothetical protein